MTDALLWQIFVVKIILSLLPVRIVFRISQRATARTRTLAFTPDFLRPIGAKPTVWAECLFVNPVADIAVLGPPDEQTLPEQAQGYKALLRSLKPFKVADIQQVDQVWLLSLERKWFSCRANYLPWVNGSLWLHTWELGSIKSGMSGSPIISDNGEAVGVVRVANLTGLDSGPQARLVRDLPGWLSYAQQRRAADLRRNLTI